MENTEENCEMIWKIWKKIVIRYGKASWIGKRYEKYGRKSSRIVKRHGKYRRKVGRIVKRHGKYRRKVSWIVKRFGKYRRNLWNEMKNMEEKSV